MLTKKQLEERINFLGGSDAAAVLGLSRWKTAVEVWAEKVGVVPAEDISGKLHIKVGNKLEDLVCDLFTDATGKKLRRNNQTLFHPSYPFIAANLDREVVGEPDSIFEAKTAGGWAAKSWEGEEIPQEYVVQVMHYLAVTGKKVGYIAVLIGGSQSFHWKTVHRDNKIIREMLKKLVHFWKTFVEPAQKAKPEDKTKFLPTMISKNDGDILASIYDKADDEEPIILGADADALIDSIKALQEDGKLLKGQIDKEKNRLKVMLGDKTTGITQNYKVTWKQQEARRIDAEQLRIEHPDVAILVTKTTKSRVLRTDKSKKPKEAIA